MLMGSHHPGCWFVPYCRMFNHIHLLLEVPPMPAEGLADAELLQRLRALYPEVVDP
jgi:putative transposase